MKINTELVGEKVLENKSCPPCFLAFCKVNYIYLRARYIYIYIYIYTLYKGEWTTYVDFNPLLTRRVSAYAFFRGLNCVRYYS